MANQGERVRLIVAQKKGDGYRYREKMVNEEDVDEEIERIQAAGEDN